MTKRILAITAHPDDESFLVGATLAKYAAEGAEVYLLCATRGEAGSWSDVLPNGRKLGEVREQEHRQAVQILGIKKLIYLDYLDGKISNEQVKDIATKIETEIKRLKPDILLTLDLTGISGHLDHIALSFATTVAFHHQKSVKKLYYYTLAKRDTDLILKLFHRRLWGRPEGEITTLIDVKKYLSIKARTVACYLTQKQDFQRLRLIWKFTGHTDKYILTGSRVKTKFPENDLFSGI